ncbi:MAG: glycosyltransferase family 4 protein [Lachnospiraceae bacterium]|jgi:glycosyltransferase involved in cell wall biosynthesis|nr:glycosyltransferase family 4 protein [Lachnospiraceae bacterium]
MKICMIVPNPAVKGGIASVVNGYRGSDMEKQHQISYVESYCDGSKWQKLFKALSGYLAFIGQLLRNRPDLIHIHSSFGPSFYRKIPFIYLGRWAGIPVVNHIHGAEFDVFYEQASEKKKKRIAKVYGKCNRLVVLSAEWKEAISQIVPADKIDIVENYCKIPEEPYDTGRKQAQILFLGELGERKGCYDIPVIYEKVKQNCPQAHLVMAGDGQMAQIKEAFGQRNLLEDVEFPGWIRGEAKEKLLRESAIFLFPTYNEGMPMAVLEAMGYGMGIVTTQVGGIPKLIAHKQNGYLEKPGDTEAMAQDVISLLQEENLSRQMGQQARNLVKQKYSLESHWQKLEQTYRKACM